MDTVIGKSPRICLILKYMVAIVLVVTAAYAKMTFAEAVLERLTMLGLYTRFNILTSFLTPVLPLRKQLWKTAVLDKHVREKKWQERTRRDMVGLNNS